jgi:hypothetical protein
MMVRRSTTSIEIRQLTDVLPCKLHEHFQCNGSEHAS